MPSDVSAFLRACITNGFIVDANLFLLLAFETSHKRTYGLEEELNITRAITSYCIEKGGKLILTPHIVAEISNMLINRDKRSNYSGNTSFIKMVELLRASIEHSISKEAILDSPHLAYIGFTDLSILEAASNANYGVLTIDNELFCRLINDGCAVANPKVIAEAKLLRHLLYSN